MRSAMVGAFLRQTADNPLNIPRPTNDELQVSVAAFAPVFAIYVTGDFDRIGAPVAAKTGAPGFDFRAPRVYVQPSWAIFDGAPVLQISCLAWFFERLPRGDLDILAGRMDGVIWRVTIVLDGRPLLYDSIHARGCYHLFFSAPPTRLKDHPVNDPSEGTVVSANAPPPARASGWCSTSAAAILPARAFGHEHRRLKPTLYDPSPWTP